MTEDAWASTWKGGQVPTEPHWTCHKDEKGFCLVESLVKKTQGKIAGIKFNAAISASQEKS